MDLNNTEILGHIHNQGIYRGDGFMVVSIFICNYKPGDYVLVEKEDGELGTTTLTEDDLLCDCGFLNLRILGLIFDSNGRNIKSHRATETSNRTTGGEVPRVVEHV
jgi:hypothetical protein